MPAAVSPKAFHVYVSARGNGYMTEIAESLAWALTELGREVEVRREGLPRRSSGAVSLVVAPHEYFELLEDDVEEEEVAEAARAAIPVATEQPGTPWFELSYEYCRRAAFALDINPLGVSTMRARGVHAHHLPLGYDPGWDAWHGEDGRERTIDVLFLGGLSPRREDFLARNAASFAGLSCRFNLIDSKRPVVEKGPNFLLGLERGELLSSAKVLVDVHRSAVPYFAWARALPALANGCLVLTETSEGYEPLVPGVHFVQAPFAALGDYALALVGDEDERRRIARSAYEFVRERLAVESIVARFLPLLEGGSPARARRPPALRARSYAHSLGRRSTGVARRVRDRALHGPYSRAHGALAPLYDSSSATQQRLKQVLLGQMDLRRRLELLELSLDLEEPAAERVHTTPAYETARPEVTVAVSLYNYEGYIEECLGSVVRSVGVTPEIVVVDDASADRSRARTLAFMERHGTVPIALVARRTNRGLAEARNLGFRLARSEFVFVLDADNAVYPRALAKLRAALAGSDAAFAYGIIERFGGERGVLSAYPWSVERLVEANYIDAMSMIRRSAWEAAGGFRGDLALYGWEDYAFWLTLAQQGADGVLVPEILTRYRVHPQSMLATTTNVETSSTLSYLRQTFPRLPWPTDDEERDEAG